MSAVHGCRLRRGGRLRCGGCGHGLGGLGGRCRCLSGCCSLLALRLSSRRATGRRGCGSFDGARCSLPAPARCRSAVAGLGQRRERDLSVEEGELAIRAYVLRLLLKARQAAIDVGIHRSQHMRAAVVNDGRACVRVAVLGFWARAPRQSQYNLAIWKS